MEFRHIVSLLAAVLAVCACGGSTGSTVTTTETSTTVPSGETRKIPHRLMADGLDGGGQPWTTAVVGTDEELRSLMPDASVDRETEVVFRFTLAESGSCPFDEMQALVFSAPSLRLYPEVPLVGQPDACTADANPHTIVVAVNPGDLPEGGFSLWVNGEDPPSGVADGVTHIASGELDGGNDLEALDASGELAVGETRIAHDVTAHCGLDRIYRPIDGRQWVLADYGGDEIDYVPPAWKPALDGEQIDLRIERPEPDRLLITAVGTEMELTYVPAAEEEGCD